MNTFEKDYFFSDKKMDRMGRNGFYINLSIFLCILENISIYMPLFIYYNKKMNTILKNLFISENLYLIFIISQNWKKFQLLQNIINEKFYTEKTIIKRVVFRCTKVANFVLKNDIMRCNFNKFFVKKGYFWIKDV